ncbi:MAG: M28 family peptidase [Ignavibacteriales bacterium]|nr:M28 family peptidase [Ignavibacteriales bacterium]
MNTIRRSVFSIFVVGGFAFAQSQRSSEITVEELKAHLRILASDELEGRRAGSRGADAAAEYLATEFSASKLEPKGDDNTYYQEFEFVAGVELGKKNSLLLDVDGKAISLKLHVDARPLGFSDTGAFEGSVVVAGYGISAPQRNYDDYEGIDVRDRAVLLLRHHPEGENPHSEFGQYSSLRHKAVKAREKGAKAIILVTGPADTDKDELMKLSYDQSVGNAGILALNLTQHAADRMLAAAGTTVEKLQEEINGSKKPRSFILNNVRVNIDVEVLHVRKKTRNVIGFLEGNDPYLKQEIVVIGAHYDHLGYGGESSGSLSPDTLAIHNGADDNGSGTAGLVELAEYFSAHRDDLKRSTLFISFSGEEMGLLGSAYFVNNPPVPLEHVTAMLNMDMIGRLRDHSLIVYGVGTSPGFEDLARQHNADSGFVLKLNKDGFGPSDHSSFYGKAIPVFHFFTDLHADYHRPSDDWDKINYGGMKQVLEYVRAIATDLNRVDPRPSYVRVETPRTTGAGRGIRSYTGTIPDFGEQVEGMKLSGVREGSPAADAGLQAGDVIIRFGTIEIKSLYDYTFALGEYKPGDEVRVVIRRGDETKSLTVVLGQRN